MLPIVLHSLAVQTFSDFEVIVADNSDDEHRQEICRAVALMDHRFGYVHVGAGDCYSSTEVAATDCNGDFLCFPSDDSYYVPCFAELMLNAVDANAWDLVYCNMLYDARFNGNCYAPVNVQPRINSIDKTGFILARKWFDGFPGKSDGPCKADGELIESLLARGIRHGKVNDILMVHN